MKKPIDLDAFLKGAAVPPLRGGVTDDASWDERADAIVASARASTNAHPADLEALTSPPSLEPEPGEPVVSVGVAPMSESDRPKPSQKRPSLKELAERVSKTPPPPSVAPPSLSPSSLASPVPSARGSLAPSLSAPPSSQGPGSLAPASLAPASVGSASVGPASVAPLSAAPVSAAAESTAAPESLAAPSNVVPITAKKAEEKGSSGAMIGIGIALAGVAAAAGLFYFLRTKPVESANSTPAKTQTAEVDPTAKTEAAATSAPIAENTPKEDGALDVTDLGDASASATAPTPEGTAPPSQANALAQNDAKSSAKGPDVPVKVNPDGTLDDAMKKVAGTDGEKKVEEAPAPAAGNPKNIPDRPATGSVTAAIGSVMGGARACVAGADDVSRATVTFGSSGAVQGVSVSGWAAGKPAASCIQSALKGANVGPFSQPTFTFGVTVRP